ncbi:hypothetical protein ID866_9669 [Astraeus odoratus]|nr:hypothetical protein ID866_9669 [Astraeus odoratus]
MHETSPNADRESNRDEYLSRPTEVAHFHSFGHSQCRDDFVLSAIDIQAGGTWLGLNRTGKLALLTNITEDTKLKFPQSRGQLVSSFLVPQPSSLAEQSSIEITEYLRGLTGSTNPDDGMDAFYAGFNLLLLVPRVSHSSALAAAPDPSLDLGSVSVSHFPVGSHGHQAVREATLTQSLTGPLPLPSSDTSVQPLHTTTLYRCSQSSILLSYDAYFVTNHGAGGQVTCRPLTNSERRYGALSNGIEGRGGDEWPKVKKGLDLFKEVMQMDQDASPTPPTIRAELRNTIFIDPFVVNANSPDFYGTRIATLVLVKRSGEVVYIERDRWVLPDTGTGPGSELSGEERKPVLVPASIAKETQREYRFKLDI